MSRCGSQWVAVALFGPWLLCSDYQGLGNGFGDPLFSFFNLALICLCIHICIRRFKVPLCGQHRGAALSVPLDYALSDAVRYWRINNNNTNITNIFAHKV